MSDGSLLTPSVCFWNYDRTLPLLDGRVAIDRCTPRFTILTPEEAFARAFTIAEFDISELSFSNHMTALSHGDAAYHAVPIFLSRAFRHSTIYVRTDRGIAAPADLAGKSVGLQEYDMTAAVVVRGMLRDEYGLQPADMRWVVGDVETVRRMAVPVPRLAGIDIRAAPSGRTLDAILAEGGLDALIALNPPPCMRRGDRKIARLFPDWRSAEQDYFTRTGFFPIMHVVGIRRALAEAQPWLAAAVYRAFCQAKELAVAELSVLQAAKVTLPWVAAELAATRAVMGDDFWPYGVAANQAALERLIGYHFAEGLSSRKLDIGDIFPLGIA
jgi:4,5-dihydroxyphthalate decarboxylase